MSRFHQPEDIEDSNDFSGTICAYDTVGFRPPACWTECVIVAGGLRHEALAVALAGEYAL